VVFRSDETGVVQGLVGAGLGYALVPLLTVARRDPRTRIVRVSGIAPREITVAWHADRTLSPGARAFVDVVSGVAAALAQEARGPA
jgi:DNA-binding transcriptional LysR family regulator